MNKLNLLDYTGKKGEEHDFYWELWNSYYYMILFTD